MDSDAIFYQFSRSKIQRCDFSHFLRLDAPHKLPSGRRLRTMMTPWFSASSSAAANLTNPRGLVVVRGHKGAGSNK